MTTSVLPVIYAELDVDEALLWAGQPDPKQMTLPGLPIFVVGLITGSYFFLTLRSAIVSGLSLGGFNALFSFTMGCFVLFFFGLFLISLGMLLYPLWLYSRAQRTYYGITSKRVISLIDGRSPLVHSLNRAEIDEITWAKYDDGHMRVYFNAQRARHGHRSRLQKIKFIGIEESKKLVQLLEEIVIRNWESNRHIHK